MYKDYVSFNGTTYVSDIGDLEEYQTHDNIETELSLRNDIEIIQFKIQEVQCQLKRLGTIEESKKRMFRNKLEYIVAPSIVFLLIAIVFLFGAGWAGLKILAALMPMIIILELLIIPAAKEEREKQNLIIFFQEQLNLLEQQLSSKKQELEAILENKTTSDTKVEVGVIKHLDVTSYREKLEQELYFLQVLLKYRKKYLQLYQEGTLEETLQEEGYDSHIELAKNVLARLRNKDA